MTTVLIVDDDADMRTLAGHVLRTSGFDSVAVEDGRRALAALATEALPDLVLLDVQMPVVDGWTTLEAIRADPRTAGLPVVFSTVKVHTGDRRRAWEAGCDGYLTKPYAVADVGPLLRAVLDRDPAERDAHRREQLALLDTHPHPR